MTRPSVWVHAAKPCRACAKDAHERCYAEWSHGGVQVFLCPCDCERAAARRARTDLPQPVTP